MWKSCNCSGVMHCVFFISMIAAYTHYIINIAVYAYIRNSNDSNDGLIAVTFSLLESPRKGNDSAGTVF